MSNYYDEINKASKSIDELLKVMKRSSVKKHNINQLIVNITLAHNVSESFVKKRLNTLSKAGAFSIVGEEIVFSGDEEE